MKQIRARVKALGGSRYAIHGADGELLAIYAKKTDDPEKCARHCAGAYVKGYNQAVQDVCDAVSAGVIRLSSQ